MEKETICFIFTGRIAVITSNALSPKPQGEPLFSTFAPSSSFFTNRLPPALLLIFFFTDNFTLF